MKFDNYMILDFPSKSCNEAFARSAVACFAAQMDPTLEELGDIRTAVSEAVTNCIVHAYPESLGTITLRCRILKDNILDIVIKDKGVGIADIEQDFQTTLEKCAQVTWDTVKNEKLLMKLTGIVIKPFAPLL